MIVALILDQVFPSKFLKTGKGEVKVSSLVFFFLKIISLKLSVSQRGIFWGENIASHHHPPDRNPGRDFYRKKLEGKKIIYWIYFKA